MQDSEVVAVAQSQAELITTRQLHAAGMTDGSIRAQIAAERWQRVFRGLYATFTGELTAAQRHWAAVLIGGGGAALSHASAAHLHGLGAEPLTVHIVVPAGRTPSAPGWVTIHRSRAERRLVGAPPRTSVADTLVDLAVANTNRDRLAALVSRAVQRRLVRPETIGAALDARGRRGNRGAGELAGLVADTKDGAHSALEVRYLRDVERAHGLPKGTRQHRVRRGGRTTFRDVLYEGHGVVVELDGRLGHEGLRDRFRDLTRDQLAAVAGEVTLRFGYWDVAGSPCEVARQVATVLGVPVRKCRRCAGSREP